MKKIFKQSFILLALLGVMFTSCKKDYPEPNITVLPVGTVYTIDSILKMEAGTVFNDDASVYGIVTADEKSGNLYKAAFIQDPETNAAIELYLNAKSGVTTGDYIRVYLKGVTYSVYNNLPQLSGFEADGHIVILANDDKRIKPMTTTIANLKANQDKYIGRLVRLENVWFTEQGTFAELNGYGERCLVDASSPTGDNNFIVRTSNYANFAQDPLPSDTGNLVAIASLYKSTWQLLVRSKSDLEFHNFSGGGGGGVTPEPPAPAGEVQPLPYVQSFTSAFGSYMTYSVEGAEKWEIDHSKAKMTGYNGGAYSANEDWLISSPVAIKDVTDAKLTMIYIGRYFNNINTEVTLWASTDYTFGNNPTEATWNQFAVTLKESGDWNTFQTAEIALTDYVGQTVTIAVKYVSTDSKAGTMEVQSIAIEEGTASGGGGGGTPPNPGNLTGDGSRENPYTASDVIAMGVETSDGNKYWVKDYIVGFVDANYNYQFTADGAVNTNLSLSKADASSSEECVPVQLPVGAIREGLNLADHPNNLGQEVLMYGTLEKYFRVPGVKNVTYAEMGGNSYGVDPGATPVVPSGEVQNMPYTQSFATEFGTYVTKNVTGAEAWEIAYSSAKMSGYSGQAYDNEDWLISSPVQITGVEHAKAIINYAAKYDAPAENDITIQVSSNYEFNAEPSAATWTELSVTIPNNSTGNAWTFTDLEVSLDEFIGQTVNVAVKYTSTTAGARTIEIATITIKEETGDTPTPPDPPTPPTPGNGEGSGTADDPYNVAAGISLQGQNVTGWVRGYIVGAVKSGPQSVSSNDDIEWAAPFSRATNVLISDDPDCHEVTNCIIVELTKDKPLRSQVNLVDNPDNLGKTLSVLGKLRNYFGQSGLRDSAGTVDDFVLADPAK